MTEWTFEDWSLGEYAYSWIGSFTLDDFILREISRLQVEGTLLGAQVMFIPRGKELYKVSGVTRDLNGQPLSYCTVRLIPTDGYGPVQETTSDGNGNYSFYVPDSAKEYFVSAFKAGEPNVFGRTEATLKGVAI